MTSDEESDGLTFEFQREITALKGDAKLLPDRRRILLPALLAGGHTRVQIYFHNDQ